MIALEGNRCLVWFPRVVGGGGVIRLHPCSIYGRDRSLWGGGRYRYLRPPPHTHNLPPWRLSPAAAQESRRKHKNRDHKYEISVGDMKQTRILFQQFYSLLVLLNVHQVGRRGAQYQTYSQQPAQSLWRVTICWYAVYDVILDASLIRFVIFQNGRLEK